LIEFTVVSIEEEQLIIHTFLIYGTFNLVTAASQ